MTNVKNALIKIGKNTKALFHIGANYESDTCHLDAFSDGATFTVVVETPMVKKERHFAKFADLCEFFAKEKLLKTRCFFYTF